MRVQEPELFLPGFPAAVWVCAGRIPAEEQAGQGIGKAVTVKGETELLYEGKKVTGGRSSLFSL